MRINKVIAQATGMSRRSADSLIADGRVTVNGKPAMAGQQIESNDALAIDGSAVQATDAFSDNSTKIVVLNKPAGYVVSRNGQGSPTIYELLPENLRYVKPIGRLDKDSSGILVLTNNGQLAQSLSHPSSRKSKIYSVSIDRPLSLTDELQISHGGVTLADGPSAFILQLLTTDRMHWQIRMYEGRNRQIRRTFSSLGYTVHTLHRTQFGSYALSDLPSGHYRFVQAASLKSRN